MAILKLFHSWLFRGWPLIWGVWCGFPQTFFFSATLRTLFFFLDTLRRFFLIFWAKLIEEFFYNMVLLENNRRKFFLGLNWPSIFFFSEAPWTKFFFWHTLFVIFFCMPPNEFFFDLHHPPRWLMVVPLVNPMFRWELHTFALCEGIVRIGTHPDLTDYSGG